MDPETRALSPRKLALSPDARGLLADFSDAVERQQAHGGDLANVKGYASKAAEQACRIAGVLTLWADLDAREVSAATMADAITLAQFYLAETLRVWLLQTWLHAEITPSEVVQRAPIRALRERPAALQSIGMVIEAGWLVALASGTEVRGKARKEVCRIVRGAGDVV